MKGIRQHPKAFVFVSLLGLVLVLGLIHKGIAGRLDGLPTSASDSGYHTTHNIRYNASVSSLRYDSSAQQAKSFHLIFLENHSDVVITSRYLFAQHVYEDDQESIVRSYNTTWLAGATVEPIEDTPPPEEVNTRDDTLTNNMGGLSTGHYWINAYTELEVEREGSNINLITPRAEAAKRFQKKNMEG